MSQADEGGPSDTELAAENESPTCVLIPTAPSQEEGPTDITASPAFQCLDEVPCAPDSSVCNSNYFEVYLLPLVIEGCYHRRSISS
ncbi:hypothetical protein Nmel_005240, partial [Mimus melanotis]